MRLHLPVSLRKSLLTCLVAAASLSSVPAWAASAPTSQNLVFNGATLTWNTDTANKAFTNEAGEAASFATGDNVSFASDATISLGEDISAGQINIASGADVVIELADNGLNFDTLSLLGGSLDVGNSLNVSSGETLAVGSNNSVLKSALVLESDSCLSVDYSGSGAATSLNNSSLSLQGDTQLQLSGCGNGDGKTYTLLSGISELKDAQGNTISLGEGNNAISSYFDTSQPGTGFWANGTLVLNDGSLQLVRHNQVVKEALTITSRQDNPSSYQYYAGVSFENISAVDNGGAISGDEVTLSNNGSVTFSGNTASNGGAIYGKTISLSNNGSVEFSGNTASWGGAIRGSWRGRTISLSNNGSVTFSGNTASFCGGAIYGGDDSTIMLSNNGRVEFRENAANGGGAIRISPGAQLLLEDNDVIEFKDNEALCGGAIELYHGGAEVRIENNGQVRFAGNSGGAIYVGAGSSLSICNNKDVIFEKNGWNNNLSSLSVESANSYNGNCKVYLSAMEENKIEFRDSIYIGAGSEIYFNENYTDPLYNKVKKQGDIIFTGKYTETHLNEVLAAAGENRKATEQEILNSRTSYVYAMTNLYGGRLRVEDEAVYQGYGITAHAGSESTVLVKDAVLNHTGYELHFYEGTKLEALGESEIFGDVIVESTATAAFSALTRLEGSLTLASGSTLLLEGALTLDGALTLGTSLTLGGNMLEMVNLLQAGQSLTLMSGLDSLAVQTGESEYTTIASGQELLAADYFSNLDSGKELFFVYNGEAGSLSMMRVIPEPATATLSLLALTALMSRRRRK